MLYIFAFSNSDDHIFIDDQPNKKTTMCDSDGTSGALVAASARCQNISAFFHWRASYDQGVHEDTTRTVNSTPNHGPRRICFI